jgi:hypothetical protein
MTDIALSDRQVQLLEIVAEGDGNWDTRRIDLTIDSRSGPGDGNRPPGTAGAAATGTSRPRRQPLRPRRGPGGRWALTAAAHPHIKSSH